MRPSTLWRHRRPLSRWGSFLLLLAVIATGLYVALPAEPRWEMPCDPSSVFNAGGGRIALYRSADGGHAGPVRLVDAATGTVLAQFLANAPAFDQHATSEDGRYLVALVPGDDAKTRRIRGVDLREQREWQAETPLGPFAWVTFSPRCDFVARLLEPPEKDEKEKCYVIHATASGRIAAQVRIPAAAYLFMFSLDGSRFVLGYHDEDGTKHIRAVSTDTGRATTLDGGTLLAVAPDARCVIANRGDDGIWVGDLADGTWRCCLGDAHSGQAVEAHLEMAVANTNYNYRLTRVLTRTRLRMPAGRRLATVRLWDVAGRAAVARGVDWLVLDRFAGDDPIFSPDGRNLLWHQRGEPGAQQLVAYDVQTGKALWRRTWEPYPRHVLFTPDSRHLVVPQANGDEVEVLDAATGATLRTIAVPEFAGLEPQFACDGRTLTAVATLPQEEPFWLWAKILEWLPNRAEPAPLMVIHMFDLATGQSMGEVACEETSEWWLTEDGRGLITVYHDNDENSEVQTVIQCWDIPPQRPLRWILGVPLALGVGLVGMRRGWRWWRRSRTAAARAVPTPS